MNVDGTDLREVAGLPEGLTSLGSPEWSADGRQIAFDIFRNNVNDAHIYVVNADGTGLQDLGPGCMPSFSPSGKQFVFSQPGRGIMKMNSDGSKREVIDATGWATQWSPDGKYIAWGMRGDIIVMNVETKERKSILSPEQATQFSSSYWNIGWSHDSRSIAWKARNRKTGGDDIVVADIDSYAGFQVLAESVKGVHNDYTFSPDNKRILFAMNNPANKASQLFFVDRENAGPPQLLPGQPIDWKIFNCAWSPDGKQITFTAEKIPQPIDWASVMESQKNEK